MVQEVTKTVFRTESGKEFDHREEAERYESTSQLGFILDACDELYRTDTNEVARFLISRRGQVIEILQSFDDNI